MSDERLARYDPIEAFETAEPNQLCHCGSLTRFQDCCAPLDPNARLARIETLSLEERSVLTVDAVRYFFLEPGGDVVELLRRNMTTDRVSLFYRHLADIWPRRMPVQRSLQGLSASQTLDGYYVGWLRPETIMRSLTRVALYAERVFISQPFHFPWQLRLEHDPVLHAGRYRTDTHRWAFTMLMLEPWIRAGLVVLVPDLRDFDDSIMEALLAAGLSREAEGKVEIDPSDFAVVEALKKADFCLEWLSRPAETIAAEMVKEDPSLGPESIPGFVHYIESQRAANPFYIDGATDVGSTMATITMPTIEDTILSCGNTRAFPFTDMRSHWKGLLEAAGELPEDARVWTPLSNAFSALKFDFLDSYDADLAFELRQDNRLHNFRRYLRNVWKTIDGSTSIGAAERHARDLADELEPAYAEAKSEWNLIHKKYESGIKKSAASTAFGAVATGVVSGFATGVLSIALSLGLHLFHSAAEKKNLVAEIANFKTRFPMSIFIDIEQAS